MKRTPAQIRTIKEKIERIRSKIDEFTLTLSELETSLNTHEYQLVARWASGGKPEIIDSFPTVEEAIKMRREYFRAYGLTVHNINISRVEVEP